MLKAANETKLLDYVFSSENADTNPFEGIEGQNILAMPGRYADSLKDISKHNTLSIYQPLKDYYNALKERGLEQTQNNLGVLTHEEPYYDAIIVRLTKNKTENLFHLGYALFLLKNQGTLFVYGVNDNGAARFEKELHRIGLETEHVYKHKSRAFWTSKDDAKLDIDLLREWISKGLSKRIHDTELEALPGLFSADKLDKGSIMLCEHLPKELKGFGADFGCGYGFLSHYVLSNDIASGIACFDHDNRAIECAKANLHQFISDENRVITFHWQDLTTEGAPKNTLDWIIMNPPFHDDADENKRLGQLFVEQAASALKKGGMLYMVANNHLPYEKLMVSHFSSIEKPHEGGGYKIFIAKV